MKITSKHYMSISFELSKGSVIIKGSQDALIKFTGQAETVTEMSDALWEELITKYPHVLKDNMIIASKSENDIKSQLKEQKEIVSFTAPTVVNDDEILKD